MVYFTLCLNLHNLKKKIMMAFHNMSEILKNKKQT